MTPDLAAVIVNFNAGDELRAALQSVADEMAGKPWEAVVVDNASTDGSDAIAHEFPQARLVRNEANVGFGRGINQGIALSTAPWILIMNPDCRLAAGAIARLQDDVDAQPRRALAGPRILDPDGTPQGSARGDPDMLTGVFGRTTALRRLFPWLPVSRRNVIAADTGGSVTVDWVSGACMLARREALLAVGGFDPRYFLYWEDADLCRRLRASGWKIRHVPAAIAVHQVGHSSRSARANSIRAFHASAYLYYATHVAPGTVSPKRWLARALLAGRCWWQLRNARG